MNNDKNDHSRHWLSGKCSSPSLTQNHINLKNNNKNIHLSNNNNNLNNNNNFANRPLTMQLENDMYYTVDFGDSQQSPLIQ